MSGIFSGLRKENPQRDYDIARIDRLTQAFKAPITTGDAELRNNAALMIARARARELARNNDYAKKYLRMLVKNVIGRDGITLQNKARDAGPQGQLDKYANDLIEAEWMKWGKKGIPTVDGRLSWIGVQKLFIRTVARDGEFLARHIRGFNNPWRYSLQILEADLLPENYNVERTRNKTLIRMGIEYDEHDRPIAYYLRKRHPGEFAGTQFAPSDYARVPASEIIHCFDMERSTQGRGITWMHTSARRLNQLGEYEYAEVIGARVGASKMGFFKKTDPMAGGFSQGDDREANSRNLIMNAEPGIFERLPAGYDFEPFLPEHPTAQFGPFVKASLRGASAGMDVSYNSLASDLEGVNFSSMRVGTIDERDGWKELQGWTIGEFILPVFEAWLDMLLLTDRTNLPYSKYDKFNAPEFRGRTFDWVDPEKDINAEKDARKAGWKSDRQIVRERFGRDLEDVYEEISEDEKLKKKYSIKTDLGETIAKLTPKKPTDTEPQPGGEEDE